MGRNTTQGRSQAYTVNRDRSSNNDYGGGGGRRNDQQHQHDDRDFDRTSTQNRVWKRGGGASIQSRLGSRQVNFSDEGPRRGGISKRTQRGGKYNKNFHMALPEGDEDMGGEKHSDQAGRARPPQSYVRGSSRGRYPRGMRGGPGRTPPGIIVGRGAASLDNVFSWNKVVLKNGTKYDKIVLLKQLLAKANTKFIPICYSKQGMNTFFYLEDPVAARTLKELDKQIEMPDGYLLGISVERTTPPNMPLTDELVEKIKVVMSNRYITEHKALNLKAFHLDEGFAGESYYAPLWRSNVMNKVLTVIMDNIPELAAMDLSKNKLNSVSLEFFSTFKTKVKLSTLHLADNKIQDMRGLEKMKGMELTELKLAGNPLVEKMGSNYIAAVRKIFPKLVKLDDKELPKEIGFDGDESTTSTDLPPTIQTFIKNPEAGSVVKMFLQEYFKLYDSDNRQPLLDAYHEEAVMSMSSFGRHDLLPAYISESRNLKRVEYEKKRHDLLRRGKLQIVAFLSKLPKTDHDLDTFTLDVPFTSPSLMTFTVTGLFKERETKQKDAVRHFNRCFIVVPQGSGFSIINETLFVSTALDLSTRKTFATPAPGPPTTNLDPTAKQAMATAFSAKSCMTIEWSVKCLEENSWNFDKAAVTFQEAKVANKIPPEAFVK